MLTQHGLRDLLVFCLLLLAPATGLGQGFLLPDDPGSEAWQRRSLQHVPTTYRVDRLDIDASIQDQVATATVAQTFHNTCSRTLRVRFCFPLPYDGAVDQMTFLVDGQELPGRLLKADDARQQFMEYVRRMRDPALVQWVGTGMFQTQVFPVPAGEKRTVTVRYTQLLRRTGKLTDWVVPLQPASVRGTEVNQVRIKARLRSQSPLANIYSPTHEIDVERPNRRSANISLEQSGESIRGDFRLLWDHGEAPVRMSMIGFREDEREDGYFMLLLQPDLPEPNAKQQSKGKQIVLAIDTSGSMRGEKIEQVRQAADHVLGKLASNDQFDLITYESGVESYAGRLIRARGTAVNDARDYVASILAGGGTNIHEALQTALRTAAKAEAPPYVVFLTDGRPTVGVTELEKIVTAAVEANQAEARVLSLGVGHDVNSRLLDKMSASLQGQSIYVRPGEPIDLHVKRLYDRIGAPALSDVDLKISVDGRPGGVRRLYPEELVDLFSGDQVIAVGRYRRGGDVRIRLTGMLNGELQKFEYRASLPEGTTGHRNAFVERLWAVRRVGAIIDQIDLNGKTDELIQELVALSKKHGILTPYTAFLADENVGLNDRVTQGQQANESLRQLRAESGANAFGQRALKGSFKSASRGDIAEKSFDTYQLGMSAGGQSGGFGGGAQRQAAAGSSTPSRARNTRPNQAGSRSPRTQDERARTAGEAVRAVAGKSFFLRNHMWIDSAASDQQIAEAESIEPFSDRYFDLLDRLEREEKAWLAQFDSVLLIVNGKAYRIEHE